MTEAKITMRETMKAFWGWIRWLLVVVSAVIALQAIDYRNKVNSLASKDCCTCNLKVILGAKASWALEKHETNNDAVPADSDLFGPNAYIREKPTCDEGGD